MEKSVKITAIVSGTVVLVVLLLLFALFAVNPSSGKTVSAQGMANVEIVPDMASLNFNVITSGKTSQEANDANSKIVDDMITALVKQGFDRKDIQTTGFSIYEDYDYTQSGRKLLGYKATHSIIVRVPTNKSSMIGNAIDASIEANATLAYINFELSQELENKYKAEAIKLAAEDAKNKAEAMASGLDRGLGKLVSISSSEFNYYPYMAYDNAVASSGAEIKQAATSITPSEQTVSASVSVVYRIN